MSKPFLHRLHARVYAASWKNPLFTDPQAKQRSSGRMRYLGYTLLVLLSCVTCCALLFWFGTQERFAITDVHVEGMRSVPQEKIAGEVLQALGACQRFFVPCLYTWNINEDDLTHLLTSSHHLDRVAFTFEEHVLKVDVVEAVTMIPVRIGSQVWFATQAGVLQSAATPEDIARGVLIPHEVYQEIDVSDLGVEGVAGLQIADPHAFQVIESYKRAFNTSVIPITSFAITKDAGKMVAYTQAGYSIFFSPWEDANTQVARLAAVLAQTVPVSYADIRFGERVYVK